MRMADVRFAVNNQYFVYDAQKGEINRRKHGISFEAAAYVFLDNLRLDFVDDRHSTMEEERWITIGLVKDVLTVVLLRTTGGREGLLSIDIRKACDTR